jgi:hypothetical protein
MKAEKLSLKGTPKSDHRTPEEIELDRLELQLRTIQLALEILTSVCATLPDYEPGSEEMEEPKDDEDGTFYFLSSNILLLTRVDRYGW